MSPRFALAVLCLAWAVLPAFAVDGDAVYYVGGTVPGLKQGQEGRFNMTSRELLRFEGSKGMWETPYKKITRLQYGRKLGRQVAAGIIVSPFWLSAPKRKHFITLEIEGESGDVRTATFEVSKDRYVETIADLEERTGLKVKVVNADTKPAEAQSQKSP